MTVGVMLPLPAKMVEVTKLISVTGLAAVKVLVAAPVLNSVTVPVTCSSCPADAVAAALENTKIPSEVSGLPSPKAS